MHIALNELFGFVSHPVCVCPFQMDMSMPAVLEHVISPFDLSVLEYNTACIYISTLPRPRLNVWQSAKRKAQSPAALSASTNGNANWQTAVRSEASHARTPLHTTVSKGESS
jgi:hypothetical protein